MGRLGKHPPNFVPTLLKAVLIDMATVDMLAVAPGEIRAITSANSTRSWPASSQNSFRILACTNRPGMQTGRAPRISQPELLCFMTGSEHLADQSGDSC